MAQLLTGLHAASATASHDDMRQISPTSTLHHMLFLNHSFYAVTNTMYTVVLLPRRLEELQSVSTPSIYKTQPVTDILDTPLFQTLKNTLYVKHST